MVKHGKVQQGVRPGGKGKGTGFLMMYWRETIHVYMCVRVCVLKEKETKVNS